MKKLLGLLMFGFLMVDMASAQEADKTPTQSVYLELGGAGLSYSLNYDFRFDKNNINSWGMRVGASGYSLERESLFTFPVQATRLFGQEKHFFEVGGGFTVMAFKTTNYDYYYSGSGGGYTQSVESEDFHFILPVNGSPNVMGTLTFAYRRIPVNGGVMWRAALTPIFNSNGLWPLFAGISFGYAF